MNNLTNVYLDTINPHTPYTRLCSIDVLYSICLHTIMYTIILCIITKLCKIVITKKQCLTIVGLLIVVMVVGYIGRLARSKALYNNYLARNNSIEISQQKAIEVMHLGYFRYYFLG